jgi:hypothetical protein
MVQQIRIPADNRIDKRMAHFGTGGEFQADTRIMLKFSEFSQYVPAAIANATPCTPALDDLHGVRVEQNSFNVGRKERASRAVLDSHACRSNCFAFGAWIGILLLMIPIDLMLNRLN